MKRFSIIYVDRATNRWTAHDPDGEGRPWRGLEVYAHAIASHLFKGVDFGGAGVTDRVQLLSVDGREVCAELCRGPGDRGALRPVESITPPGIVGQEPEEEAVPLSRAVLNGRQR
jgi:hypothetical protein